MSEAYNPPAFPMGDPTHGGYDGMTLRDWFAGQALAELISRSDDAHTILKVTAKAYLYADAMLAAREGGAS